MTEEEKSTSEERVLAMGQGTRYNVDVVMCIDCTGSMKGILDTVKKKALNFYPDLHKGCEKNGKDISELRIRVIGFRDFGCDGNSALEDSGFLDIPERENDLKDFVNGLEPQGGGDEPEDALEVLAMAIHSDWTRGGDKRRHVIVIWSDASTHPLEWKPDATLKILGYNEKQENPIYPQNMPKNFDELTDMWENDMDEHAKRLIVFAPNAADWTKMSSWNSIVHHPAKAGEGLSELDYELIMNALIKSI